MATPKEIQKIFRTQSPLDLDLVRFRDRFTLGESILIFYGIHPIKPFSNLLQMYVYETLSCDEDTSIIIDEFWLEEVFKNEAQIYSRLLSHVKKESISNRDLFRLFDIQGILKKLLERWKKESYFRYEFECFFKGEKKEKKTLSKADFKYLLMEMEFDVPEFFDVTSIPTFFEVLDVDKDSSEEELETENTNEGGKQLKPKMDLGRSAQNGLVEFAYLVLRSTKNRSKLKVSAKDILSDPLMKEIVKALKSHSKRLDFKFAGEEERVKWIRKFLKK